MILTRGRRGPVFCHHYWWHDDWNRRCIRSNCSVHVYRILRLQLLFIDCQFYEENGHKSICYFANTTIRARLRLKTLTNCVPSVWSKQTLKSLTGKIFQRFELLKRNGWCTYVMGWLHNGFARVSVYNNVIVFIVKAFAYFANPIYWFWELQEKNEFSLSLHCHFDTISV